MRLQRFVSAWVWCLAGSLAIAAVVVGLEKFGLVAVPGAWWWSLAAGGALATVVAAAIALATGPDRVEAAVAIDRRFGLNERLSTALTLPADLRETPAGRALVADAIRHVDDLDIGSQFGLRRPRLAWVPVVPLLVAAALAYLPEDLLPRAAAATKLKEAAKTLEKESVKKALASVSKKLEEKKKQLDKVEAAETGKLMAELQQAVDKLAKAPPAEKEKALVEMNKLADALKERQKQLGDSEQISRQLQQLEELGQTGPADEFAKDLAKGDFARAAEQVKKLREKLAKGELSEKEKEQLQKQLGEMQKRLQEMANMDQRKQQLKDALAKGQISQENFDQQMAKLQQQAEDMQKLGQLAQQLAQAQEKMSQGEMQKAAEALGLGQEQLEQMAQAVQELETLDSALADLQDAKNGMAGDGMNQLGDQLQGMNSLGQGNRPGNGNGTGRGRGQGDRPEAPDNTSGYDTRVRQQIGKGRAIMTGLADPSKQVKGESILADQATVEAAAGAAAEALTEQKIPSESKHHVSDYFDKLRKGD
jgi:hypothetical protein